MAANKVSETCDKNNVKSSEKHYELYIRIYNQEIESIEKTIANLEQCP